MCFLRGLHSQRRKSWSRLGSSHLRSWTGSLQLQLVWVTPDSPVCWGAGGSLWWEISDLCSCTACVDAEVMGTQEMNKQPSQVEQLGEHCGLDCILASFASVGVPWGLCTAGEIRKYFRWKKYVHKKGHSTQRERMLRYTSKYWLAENLQSCMN